MTILTFVI